MFGLRQKRDYTCGMGVEVDLPRAVTRYELEAAINRVLKERYARELWTETCRAELDDVTDDNHFRTGSHAVTGFAIGSCVSGMGLSVRFGDYHWQELQDARSTYNKINFGCVEMVSARWGMCCDRHELGRPERRARVLTANASPNEAAAWFVESLLAALR